MDVQMWLYWNHYNEKFFSLKKKKKEEILTHGTIWKNLEDIMPNEITPAPKDEYCMIPFTRDTWSTQSHRGRRWNNGGCQSCGIGKDGEFLFKGSEFQIGEDKKVLEIEVMMFAQQHEYT